MGRSYNINVDTQKVDPKECLDIGLTDIQFHSQKVRKTRSIGRQVVKMIRAEKTSGRAYSNKVTLNSKGGVLLSELEMERLHELARQKGKKYVRISVPKGGLPVFFGRDTLEKLNSLRKRGLDKHYKI